MRSSGLFALSLAIVAAAVIITTVPVIASRDPHPVQLLEGAELATATLASSRTVSVTNNTAGVGNQAYGLANLWVTITDADNSETGVSMACTGSPTDADDTTDYRIPACIWDSDNTRYNCEAGPLMWNPSDETSPKKQLYRVDIEGVVNWDCVFSFTGGSASDSIAAIVEVATKS